MFGNMLGPQRGSRTYRHENAGYIPQLSQLHVPVLPGPRTVFHFKYVALVVSFVVFLLLLLHIASFVGYLQPQTEETVHVRHCDGGVEAADINKLFEGRRSCLFEVFCLFRNLWK